jgi:hypoxanthine phosphoribosyltransferase
MPIDLEEIQRVRDEADCLMTAQQVDGAISEVARQITARLKGENPMVYCVMIPKLDFPLEVAYLHATRYGHALTGTFLDWRVRPSHDLKGRSVLVIDDILDEGHTLVAIVDHLKSEGAREVLTAVLINKVHDRKARPGQRADFSGLDVEDRYLFGCGMDYKGYWRNLPGIYALKGS